MIVKYESSIKKQSLLDSKTFLLMIEMQKKPLLLTVKLKLMDLLLSIENSEELLMIISTINVQFPEISFSLEDDRRVFMKFQLYLSNSNFLNLFFLKTLESIDYLLIIATNFYIVSIKTFLYGTYDVSKYAIFSKIIQGSIELYKREISLYL